MTLGHLGQFDEIHCDSRTHKVLSNYILTLGYPVSVDCEWSFQVHMFNFTIAVMSRFWSILGIFGHFFFFFCQPFGRDSIKKRNIQIKGRAPCENLSFS